MELLGSLFALGVIFLPLTINWVMEFRRRRRERPRSEDRHGELE